MPIIGFNYDKILVERKGTIKRPLNIHTDVSIKDVEEEKIPLGKTEDILKFNFEFNVKYDELGQLVFNGHVLYLEDPKKTAEIMKEWKKTKQIETNLMSELINTILQRCNIKALTVSQDVNLPPHLKLPKLVAPKSPKDYIG